MKNLFKKIGALLVAAVMVLAMASTAFAAVEPAKITVNNLDEHATITNVQIIEPDQTTETGWKFSNGAEASFKKVSDWKNLTDQQILWKLIKYANENASVPEGTFKADVADFQAAMGFVEKELASSYTSENVAANVITATKAGVYAIKATTTDHKNYVYSPMAAFVSFGTYTTEPTSLVGVTVNAKRTTIKIDKEAKDEDGVVEIGKNVTYTVTTNVPYIADDVADVTYTITDTIQGADYNLNDDNKTLDVKVKIGSGNETTYKVNVTTTVDGKKQFVLDLSDVARVRTNANAEVVITYNAIVKSEVVNNSVKPNDGTHDFTPKTNTLYTGKITMTKTDDSKDAVRLANAGFVIYRVDGTKTNYALVTKDKMKTENNEYVVTGWTNDLEDAKKDANLIMTDKNGEAVVRGLDDSYTYNFKEIKAPEGYSVNTTDSVATWGTNQTAENRTGTATMSDTKLNSLPSTGGMGTYLFTIIGVVVMAGAAGAFFISRRKGSEE